jgi:hypothetical protein
MPRRLEPLLRKLPGEKPGEASCFAGVASELTNGGYKERLPMELAFGGCLRESLRVTHGIDANALQRPSWTLRERRARAVRRVAVLQVPQEVAGSDIAR